MATGIIGTQHFILFLRHRRRRAAIRLPRTTLRRRRRLGGGGAPRQGGSGRRGDAGAADHGVGVSPARWGSRPSLAPRSAALNWRALSQVNLDKLKREVPPTLQGTYICRICQREVLIARNMPTKTSTRFPVGTADDRVCPLPQEVIDEARLNLQKEYDTTAAGRRLSRRRWP